MSATRNGLMTRAAIAGIAATVTFQAVAKWNGILQTVVGSGGVLPTICNVTPMK